LNRVADRRRPYDKKLFEQFIDFLTES